MDPATAGGASELLAPLRSELASTAVLCDVDGTLAPIVDDPAEASVPEGTRDVLRDLAGRCALVACVTGRRAVDARRIVGVDELTYAGNHGFELLEFGAAEAVADPSVAARAGRSREFVEGLDAARLGAAGLMVEDKGPIQALHWRRAPAEGPARMQAQEVAKLAQGAGLVPRWGRKVLEIRPVAGIDKGSATFVLISRSTAQHALFGGDDVTDIDAFRALRWMGRSGRLRTALGVGVASEEAPPDLAENVQLVVEGTEGFVAVLRGLLEGG